MTIRTQAGQFRHTVILASTRRGLERFDSLDAMPAVLRARCLKALESRESGTVVIAGQAETPEEGGAPAHCPGAPETPPASATAAWKSQQRLARWLGLAVAALAAAAWLLHWRA